MDISEKERRRHIKTFAFAHKIAKGFFVRKFNFSYDSLENIPQPYMLLANHNLNLDPALVGIASKNQLYFVASEHVTHNKFLYFFLNRYLHPIIHVKGSLGMRSTMEIIKTLRQGMNVGMFPEGNRSFDGVTDELPEVTGRLAKKSGAGLVTFRIEGGYLTQPRWGDSIRKGKTYGRLVNYYSPERLKSMTEQEVNEAINNDLHEDAYERQKEWQVEYKGKKPAKYMESTLFACPGCGGFSTLVSGSKKIRCTECGFEAVYDSLGYLTDRNGEKYTIRDLNESQKKKLEEYAEKSGEDDLLFSDRVELAFIDGHKKAKSVDTVLKAYKDRFEINGVTVRPEEIKGAAIYLRNHLVIDMGKTGEHYEINGTKRFCALKYLYLYRIMKNKEEN